MTQPTEIIDATETQDEESSRQKLGRALFDHRNPRMITFLYPAEIERLSILSSFSQAENKYRQQHGYGKSMVDDVLQEIFILRCSQKGWRAEQGVEILKNIIDSEDKQTAIDKFKHLLKI